MRTLAAAFAWRLRLPLILPARPSRPPKTWDADLAGQEAALIVLAACNHDADTGDNEHLVSAGLAGRYTRPDGTIRLHATPRGRGLAEYLVSQVITGARGKIARTSRRQPPPGQAKQPQERP